MVISFALMVFVVVVLDQLMKLIAGKYMDARCPPKSNGNYAINIQKTTTGNILFLIPRKIVLPVWILVALVVIFVTIQMDVFSIFMAKVSIALLIGGSLSNVADWFVRGYVLDFAVYRNRLNGNIADLSMFLGLAGWLGTLYGIAQ